MFQMGSELAKVSFESETKEGRGTVGWVGGCVGGGTEEKVVLLMSCLLLLRADNERTWGDEMPAPREEGGRRDRRKERS